jgi:hypothetical protein
VTTTGHCDDSDIIADVHTAIAESLEKPVGDIYLKTSNTLRPHFTGDVYENVWVDGASRDVALIQHPCTLTDRNSDVLKNRVIVAVVAEGGKLPWRGFATKMHLPFLREHQDYHIDFDQIHSVEGSSLAKNQRIRIMSHEGASLLLQRFNYYNSRVCVKSSLISEVIQGPFSEVNLKEEFYLRYGTLPFDINGWLREGAGSNQKSRQEMLELPENALIIRKEMLGAVKMHIANENQQPAILTV